ncbi:MAG: radical SAM protein [Nitrospirota bacterium]
MDINYLADLESCQLCEHRCAVNRLKGEPGVCRMGLPEVASATLHPAPPQSYTIFMAGCNFKCLNCQNWSISQYPDNGSSIRGFVEPGKLALESINHINSMFGRMMEADRIFFSGGEPTIHLPYIEKLINEARKIDPSTKVNFDTNGFMTEESLKRVLNFTTSITYDIKAFHDETHRALTGASVEPVLRNAAYIGKYAKEKLWEYRILVIPGINEAEIGHVCEFISSIDPSLPVCFLAFRPNFIMESHQGASTKLMQQCVKIAEKAGLKNASWSGHTGLQGKIISVNEDLKRTYILPGAALAGTYALQVGCVSHPRDCRNCQNNQACKIKCCIPAIST